MTTTRIKIALLIPIMALSACRSETEKENSTQNVDASHVDNTLAWQTKRTASLKADDGWLNLAGLYWLKEGENRVGSAESNSVRFPEGKADAQLGTFTLKDGTLQFIAEKGQQITLK